MRTAALATATIGAGAFAIAVVSGMLYEQAQRARDREHFPQIGRSVDIGGRTLNIYCTGAGQPAVILESGANWAIHSAVHDPKTIFANGGPRPGYSWVSIQRALATVTTVCWYDRAGSGWSDLGPYPRDSASQARDLHALLRAAGVPPPYVLAGESSAALDAGQLGRSRALSGPAVQQRETRGAGSSVDLSLAGRRGAVVQPGRALPFGTGPSGAGEA
jgi:hypothetical protein